MYQLILNSEVINSFSNEKEAADAIPVLRAQLIDNRPSEKWEIMLGDWIIAGAGIEKHYNEYEVMVDNDSFGIGWFASAAAARSWGMKQRGFLSEMHAELKLGRPVYVSACLNPSLPDANPETMDLDDGSSEI